MNDGMGNSVVQIFHLATEQTQFSIPCQGSWRLSPCSWRRPSWLGPTSPATPPRPPCPTCGGSWGSRSSSGWHSQRRSGPSPGLPSPGPASPVQRIQKATQSKIIYQVFPKKLPSSRWPSAPSRPSCSVGPAASRRTSAGTGSLKSRIWAWK